MNADIFNYVLLAVAFSVVGLMLGRLGRSSTDTEDSGRVAFIERNHAHLSHVDGRWAVLRGEPLKVVGKPDADLRKAIDIAIIEVAKKGGV